MSLSAGTRLGVYEILALIGIGGMGEVYRARDTKLNRDVALKVLPHGFTADPERLARFKREAYVLASLNHPNIQAIYGFEESDGDGIRALVLELVDGPTVADLLGRGPLPIDEALRIAKQIAQALEAAHEQGIIHRDLKPANIKVRDDGTVKVLDFGLAKAVAPASASAVVTGPTDSPTITKPLTTQSGVILGTAPYMSPEQARGLEADKRSDVWAFGCLLYELLTGRRAFDADDFSTTLATVIMKDPDWTALPPTVPPPLRMLLQRCLEKDRRERVPDLYVARFVMSEPTIGAAAAGSLANERPSSRLRLTVSWAATILLTVTLALLLVLWSSWRAASPARALQLEVGIGADASLITRSASLAISPDGSILAFVARNNQGTTQLYVRRLSELRAVPLNGTVDAADPFFSPDGQWVAFFAGGQLRKVAVAGGAVVTVCTAPAARGGAWAEDGSIVFQPTSTGSGLLRVPSSGGAPATLTTLSAGEVTHRWPQVLPGGKGVLFTAHASGTDFDDATLIIQPFPDGAPKVVHRGAYYGRYVTSGHLTYVNQGTLFAEPFDLARLQPTGPAVPVVEGVSTYPGGTGGKSGSAMVAWTEAGTVVYLSGVNGGDEAPIQWMDRTGRVSSLRAAPANWSSPSVAPDGARLAFDSGPGQTDVWVYEWARDALTRVTVGPAANQKPVWTPDGQRIVFQSNRDKKLNLYWRRADGTGDAQRLTESSNPQTPASWHPSGKFLAFWEGPRNILRILPIEGSEASGWKPGQPTVFLNAQAFEPMFSPDGRWIAYHSSETGRFEVYVRPFPGPGAKWQISTDGGQLATWSRTRPEIVYANPENRLMVASYTVEGDVFRTAKPRPWSERPFMLRPRFRSFTLHPDGERVVLAAAPDGNGVVKQDKLVFILNFFVELRRIAPVTQ